VLVGGVPRVAADGVLLDVGPGAVVDVLHGRRRRRVGSERPAQQQLALALVGDRVGEAHDVAEVARPGDGDVGAIEAQVARRERSQVRVLRDPCDRDRGHGRQRQRERKREECDPSHSGSILSASAAQRCKTFG
jgi:hypothetical protein